MIPGWLQWVMIGIFVLQIVLFVVTELMLNVKADKPLTDQDRKEAEKLGLVVPNTETVTVKIIIPNEDRAIHEDTMRAFYMKLGKEAFKYADVIEEDVPHLMAKEYTAVLQVMR